jgi:hypothetical protein
MPHHRCHRNRATSRYIVAGRTGVEFIDLATGEAFRHHWVRGVCQYGFIPCNGLLYAPPHSCACYIEGKLTGFLALAPKATRERAPVKPPPRLEGGTVPMKLPPRDARREAVEWPTYRHDPARSGSTPCDVPARLHVLWERPVGGRLTSPVVAGGSAFVASVNTHTIHAVDVKTGEPVWHYTAGGRVDSPPTITRGRVVFGSGDGWIHCLRASDGALAWRFRAAPEDRRAVSFGQLASVWPVHGSVLAHEGSVYCAAGRSSYLDGGIYLLRLDLANGRKLAEERIYTRDPETGEQPDEPIMFEMAGALPDILSTDGELVYMRHLCLDPVSLRPREPRPHLYSPAGFLNDDWWHRTYWVSGGHFYSGYIGWYFAGRETPAGRLLVIDDTSVYGFSYKPEYYRGSTGRRYHLFAADKKDQPPPPPPDYPRANRAYPPRGSMKFSVTYRWSRDVPILARAMLRAKGTIFAAGPPKRALQSPAAFAGEEGSILCAVSTQDGSTVAAYLLNALPVSDGMAATEGRLFMSLQDGRLVCLGDGASAPGAQPLPPYEQVRRTTGGTSKEPGLVGHWRFEEGTGSVARDSSGRNNHGEVFGRWAAGASGTGVATGGAPGAVTIRDGADFHFGTSSFSIACWVHPERFDTRLMGKEDFPRTWWVINLLADGRVELVLGEGRERGKTVRPTSARPLEKERWTHFAFTVDRERGVARWYLDGKLDTTTTIPPTLSGSLSVEGKDLRIPSAHKPFAGRVDELKIYRRALTSADVKACYEDRHGGREGAK